MDDMRVLERRPIFAGKVVDLAVERVELPNGNTTELEIVRHPGAAAVVPVRADGEVLLVRQYRHAAGQWLLEVPAGTLEPGETPENCASREIQEEVGVRGNRLDPLGWLWTTPGFTDEKIHLFLARDLEAVSQALEDDEVLSIAHMPLATAVGKAHDGEICDAKSICALLRADQFLRHERGV